MLRVSQTLKLATLALWRDALAGGQLQCWQGSVPTTLGATLDDADRVVSVPLPLGTVSAVGTTSASLAIDPTPVLSDRAGAVGWVRGVDAGGNVVFDAEAGLPGSGAVVVFSALSIAVLGEVDPVLTLTL